MSTNTTRYLADRWLSRAWKMEVVDEHTERLIDGAELIAEIVSDEHGLKMVTVGDVTMTRDDGQRWVSSDGEVYDHLEYLLESAEWISECCVMRPREPETPRWRKGKKKRKSLRSKREKVKPVDQGCYQYGDCHLLIAAQRGWQFRRHL